MISSTSQYLPGTGAWGLAFHPREDCCSGLPCAHHVTNRVYLLSNRAALDRQKLTQASHWAVNRAVAVTDRHLPQASRQTSAHKEAKLKWPDIWKREHFLLEFLTYRDIIRELLPLYKICKEKILRRENTLTHRHRVSMICILFSAEKAVVKCVRLTLTLN